jgi:hypothetical protein
VQKDEPLSMIFEDLNEAVTSLMRLAKPLNDYHLIGDRSQVDESTRSKICAQLLLELEGMFPQTAGYILSRLATSFSDTSPMTTKSYCAVFMAHWNQCFNEDLPNRSEISTWRTPTERQYLHWRPVEQIHSVIRYFILTWSGDNGNAAESMTCQLCTQLVPSDSASILR